MEKLHAEAFVILLLLLIGILGQFSLAILICIMYFLGLTFSFFALRTKNGAELKIYNLFFFVYGTLCCLTQFELINNPAIDYFISFDASHSYYWPFSQTAQTTTWSRIIKDTLFEYEYSDRPLTSLIGTSIIKIGNSFGVEDTRLLGRFWIVMLSSLIPSIIASALKIYDFSNSRIYRYVIPFGLISYLYISSSVFIRDLQIYFYFTLASYIFLLPRCKFRLLWFILVFLLTFGHRLESGVLLSMYVLGYYFTKFKKNIGIIAYLFAFVVILSVLLYAQEMVSEVENTLVRYDGYAKENVGGLFQRLYALPFPFNTIIMVVYMLLMPLPLTKYILERGGSWLTLPYVLSPYLMSMIFIVTGWYAYKKYNLRDKHVVLIIIALISFVATTFGSPDIRRAFASVPGLFIVYCVVRPYTPRKVVKNVKEVAWPMIAAISAFFLIYTLK